MAIEFLDHGGVEQGLPIERPRPEAVMVRGVDFNPALTPWERMFDGWPFSDKPQWLLEALAAQTVKPHNTGSTDYAQWWVLAGDGLHKNARPGDWIVRLTNYTLAVCPAQIAEAILGGRR